MGLGRSALWQVSIFILNISERCYTFPRILSTFIISIALTVHSLELRWSAGIWTYRIQSTHRSTGSKKWALYNNLVLLAERIVPTADGGLYTQGDING